MSSSLLTVQEAADLLRVRPGTIYSWVEERPPRIPVIKLGPRLIRFDRDELLEYVGRQKVGGAA